MTELIILLGSPQIKWIVALIGIDVVLGIIVALMKKSFRLGKLANFMLKPVLGYVFGFAVLAIAAQSQSGLASTIIPQAAFILVILALIGSILNNLGRMGLGLPNYLKKD